MLSVLIPTLLAFASASDLRGGLQRQAQSVVGRVVKLRLINTDTNQPIQAFDPLPAKTRIDLDSLPTANINIEAVFEGRVDEVTWFLNGDRREERSPPWAFCGNQGTDFYKCFKLQEGVNGSLSVGATVDNPDAGKIYGESYDIDLEIFRSGSQPPPPMSFTLIRYNHFDNMQYEQGIMGNTSLIMNGFQLGRGMNVRANVAPSLGPVGSVQFMYDGKPFRTENSAPFALNGNAGSAYFPFFPSPGRHTVTATAFRNKNAQGTRLASHTINFVVRDDTTNVDLTGPTLLEFFPLTPTFVNVTDGSGEIRFRVRAQDDASGIAAVSVSSYGCDFDGPPKVVTNAVPIVSTQAVDLTVVVSIDSDHPGDAYFIGVTITDGAGNTAGAGKGCFTGPGICLGEGESGLGFVDTFYVSNKNFLG